MRLYLLLVIALFFLYSPYAIGQDSTWIKIDLADFAEANAMAEYIDAADFLAHRVAQRRKEGPMRASLVENYHKVALWYMQAGYNGQALIFIDSTIVLRNTTKQVTLTQIARSEHLKGEILLGLGNYYLSGHWFDIGLNSLKTAFQEGDSLSTNLSRIQTFTTRSAYVSTINRNFLKSQLLLNDFLELNVKGKNKGLSLQTTVRNSLLGYRARAINYQKQGMHENARIEYQKGLVTSFNYSNRPSINNRRLSLMTNLANNFLEAGQYEDARLVLQEVLENLNKAKPNVGNYKRLINTQSFMATLEEAEGHYEAVHNIIRNSRQYHSLAFPSGKGSNLGYLLLRAAQASADQGQFNQAEEYFHQSINALVEDTTNTELHQLPIIRNNTFYAAQDVFVEYLAVRQNAFIQEADAGKGVLHKLCH